MNPHYVFIHGANQNSSCWKYIVNNLNPTEYTFLDYNSNFSFEDNLTQMNKQMQDLNNVFFIAHSLGGIYSVHLYKNFRHNVIGAVTMSTPYGGSCLAKLLRRCFPSYQLLKDICPSSDPIVEANRIVIDIPWTQVVSTDGHHPIHLLPNDGVVTISSMMHRNDINYIKVDYDHYNILQSKEVVETINILSRSS